MGNGWVWLKERRVGLLGLFAGLVLLYGRYDWSPEGTPFSFRSYVLSAFFLVLFLPIFHFFLKLWVRDQRIAKILTGVTGIVFTLPYQWLGLRAYLYPPVFYFDCHAPGLPRPSLQWLPDGFQRPPSIPYEAFCFGLLLGLGLCAIGLKTSLRSKQGKWSLAIFLLLLLQAWLHLSMRSPYTYIPHFEQPPANDYFYVFYLFPGAQGAVNMDYWIFRYAEEMFIGANRDLPILANRMFPAYLASQLGSFINPYYIWLFLNVGFWGLGVFSVYYLGRQVFGKNEGFFAALIMASAQGIILYVNQPKGYTVAISGIAILLAAQCFLLHGSRPSLQNTLIFGVLFGLFSLCYEGQPWIIALPLMARALGLDWRRTLAAVVLGFSISSFFLWMLNHIGHVIINPSLALVGNPVHPVDHVVNMIKGGEFRKIFHLLFVAKNSFIDVMKHAFPLVLIPAVLGFFLAQGKRKYLFTLLIPALMTWFLMELGESSYYVQFPRLVYSAYPSIYLAAGVLLALIFRRVRVASVPGLGQGLAWLFILTNFVYMNLDVWGYPDIYYSWFYRDQGHTLAGR